MLIGSSAMKIWFPEFREPKDKDYFNPAPIEGGDVFWHESFPEKYWAGTWTATPNLLYTIKVSHCFWSLHGTWSKHMNDIIFLQRNGAVFNRAMYDILYPVWEEKHGKKRVNLNMTSDDFFNEHVDRKYDHDSLHESVAYNDRPMYEKINKDGAEVAVDMKKFWLLDYDEQLKMVREEVYATALERWVIPSDYTCSPRGAYAKAMQKTLTSLTKGQFALFIALNYNNLYAPDVDYVQVHKNNAHRLRRL